MMTPKERAAMQQALGALEAAGYGGSYAAIDLREALKPTREGKYYYKDNACTAYTAESPDCICWHDEALAEPQITTPDVCGEVCARAKLCYGCNKDLEEANAKYVEQAEQEPVADIVYDEFGPRIILRKSIKELPDGMQLFTAPVRTKDLCNPLQDLTDAEIDKLHSLTGLKAKHLNSFARSVIAAHKEKNK